MTSLPTVFLDTSVHKHAIRSRELLRRPAGALTWQIVEEDPVEERGVAPGLRAEIDLLEEVSAFAREGSIELVTHLEAIWELMGNLLVPSPGKSVFEGVPVRHVENPIPYSRLLTPFPGSASSPRALTLEFLQGLQHPRYLEIRRACGAYQGERPSPPNQLMDALLLWCADAARVNFFLTTDLSLVRTVRACKSVTLTTLVVPPSALLDAVRRARSA